MRNKKLISMLMLSAGFVACTQDEIVENGFAGIENQKDLVEDVTLNISLGEGTLTRAAYAGGATELEAGERTDYEVYQNFYLEPEWTVDASGNKTGWNVSDVQELRGDMIGFSLNLNGAAITNYPFYLAGYGSADKVVANADGTTTTTKKVFGLAEQSGLYYLSVPTTEFKKADLSEVTTSITNVGKILVGEDGQWGDLDPLALDVRKGIVRTNSGIMTGDYIAYFPYNSKFVDPDGIPAQGKEALKDIYAADLADSREGALANVNFYDYLFANARKAVEVKGGTKAGDVSIVPQTSALTFAFTNTSKTAVEKIKRITIKAATEGDEPFILAGRVSLDNLNSVKAEKTTGLIGAQFTKADILAANFNADGTVASQTWKYVTIPYMAVETDGKYIIEIYNNNGEIATIPYEPTNVEIGLGKAGIIKIDLGTKEFKKGTRKIFTVEDFEEEAPAGGELELMRDLWLNDAVKSFELGTAEAPVDLTIIGGKNLTFTNSTLHANIVMKEGQLTFGTTTVTGNVTGDVVIVNNNGKVNGNINATGFVQLYGVTQDSKYAVVAPEVAVVGGTYNNITADVVYMNNDATLSRTYEIKNGVTNTLTCVTAKKELAATDGTINYAVADYVTVRKAVTVAEGGHLEANTIEITSYIDADKPAVGGVLTVNGTVKAGAKLNIGSTAGSEVKWATAQDMNLNVTNEGTLLVGETTKVISGTLTNKGVLTLAGDVAGQNNGVLNQEAGTLNIQDNFTLVAFTVNVNGGVLEIASEATMSGRSASLVVNGGEVIKVTTKANFATDLAKTTTTFAAKYTALRVNSKIDGINANTAAVEKVYLEDNAQLIAANGKTFTLPAVYVNGNAKLESASVSKAASITINNAAKLTVTGKLNVTGNVVNWGVYDGTGAVVNCADFSGNGKWTDNVTPNC